MSAASLQPSSVSNCAVDSTRNWLIWLNHCGEELVDTSVTPDAVIDHIKQLPQAIEQLVSEH